LYLIFLPKRPVIFSENFFPDEILQARLLSDTDVIYLVPRTTTRFQIFAALMGYLNFRAETISQLILISTFSMGLMGINLITRYQF
jgi:hypothetical protein